MADNYLERHREEYEARKKEWLKKKDRFSKTRKKREFSRFFYVLTMVYRANFKSSCFVPTCRNSTVAFVFSPSPSICVTVPMPKR